MEILKAQWRLKKLNEDSIFSMKFAKSKCRNEFLKCKLLFVHARTFEYNVRERNFFFLPCKGLPERRWSIITGEAPSYATQARYICLPKPTKLTLRALRNHTSRRRPEFH